VSSSPVAPTYYADFSGLEGLKKNVKADDPKAIRAAAQQFESLFTNMMLKSMRDAKLGQGLGDSQQSDLYQDMYDQQISLKMAQGKGLGLADMLVQQLTRNSAAKAAASPAASAAAPVNAAPSTSDRTSFVKMLEPYAEKAAGQLGVASDTLIAQAALETGWGQHVPGGSGGGSSLNLYGVKAGGNWNGDAVSALTTEYGGGNALSVSQPFRRYSSVQQGVNDYVTLLQRNSRYQKAMGTGDDVGAFGSALAGGGYATDPAYVQKLQATVSSVKALRGAAAAGALKNSAPLPNTVSGESS
jgi:peptidoglycan hydrolase FlgJ